MRLRLEILLVVFLFVVGDLSGQIIDLDNVSATFGTGTFARESPTVFRSTSGPNVSLKKLGGDNWATFEFFPACGDSQLSSAVGGGFTDLATGKFMPPEGFYDGMPIPGCTSVGRDITIGYLFLVSVFVRDGAKGGFEERAVPTGPDDPNWPGDADDYYWQPGFEGDEHPEGWWVFDPKNEELEIIEADPIQNDPTPLEVGQEPGDGPVSIPAGGFIDPPDPAGLDDLSAVEEYLRQIRDEIRREGDEKSTYLLALAEYEAEQDRITAKWMIEEMDAGSDSIRDAVNRVKAETSRVVEQGDVADGQRQLANDLLSDIRDSAGSIEFGLLDNIFDENSELQFALSTDVINEQPLVPAEDQELKTQGEASEENILIMEVDVVQMRTDVEGITLTLSERIIDDSPQLQMPTSFGQEYAFSTELVIFGQAVDIGWDLDPYIDIVNFLRGLMLAFLIITFFYQINSAMQEVL